VDPELIPIVETLPEFSFVDLASTRAVLDELAASLEPDLNGIVIERHSVPGLAGEPDVEIQVVRPREARPRRAALVTFHSGGFAVGSAELDLAFNVELARRLDAVVVAVDYRLAPEHPFPAAVNDGYGALVWLAGGGGGLDVDTARVAVVCESAGGGLAASVALMAREQGGPPIRMLCLLEPELDDRLGTPSMNQAHANVTWKRDQAVLSWEYYLRGGSGEPSPIAAPARQTDLSGLPEAYVTVNQLDCLRDEGLDFARLLLASGGLVELHCWPGTVHGFRVLAPGSAVARRAVELLISALDRALNEPASAPADRESEEQAHA